MLQRSAVLIGDGLDKDLFIAWYEKMNTALLECGYVDRKVHFNPAYSCASLAEWKLRFTTWIADPLNSSLHYARHLFDLKPALGNNALIDELEAVLKEETRKNPAFVYLLANDCMGNLPPLTFFRDPVIDESGETSATFELEKTALRPLVDVGRVFGIAAGQVRGSSTQDRFRLARTLLPEHESIFREASATLRVVLYQQARSAIRNNNSGATLNPGQLSHYDRQLLKSGFRSIHRLLEFTADGSWLESQ
jgi:CBS domain-containing protein